MKTLEGGFQLERVLGIVNGSIREGFQSIWVFLYAKSDCSYASESYIIVSEAIQLI